ncbi:glycosyltransferase family 4 protein [Gemmatimonas groenlandica]|uniref:Glycosyltransferase family 4 protein n=1 Tax=Gemmatimonas groenlandica TaxID=2732249 RepID=A0A6M4IUF8_9BACT|nr:glycosyltransferase family 4 protein [Gemmatimonas groenlandica]
MHIASYLPSHLGGLEIAAWSIARGVARRGYQIDYFASGDAVDCEPLEGFAVYEISSVDPFDRPLGLPVPLWSLGSMSQLVRAVRRADVVHIHDTLYMGSVLGAVLSVLLRCPLVLTVHTSKLQFRHRVLRLAFFVANASVTRFILSRATRVAFVGTTAEEFHSTANSVAAKSAMIPNGVDAAIFSPFEFGDRRFLRRSMGIESRDFVVAFVGRFVEKKGIHLLQQAVESVRGVRWVFIGDGTIHPEGWRVAHDSTLQLTGQVGQASLADLYRSADVVLSIGVGEGGTPLVVKESMACGTPVLVSMEVSRSLGDPRPPGVWTVDASAPDASLLVAHMVERLKSGREEVASVREATAAFARRWDWDFAAREYDAMYRSLRSRR